MFWNVAGTTEIHFRILSNRRYCKSNPSQTASKQPFGKHSFETFPSKTKIFLENILLKNFHQNTKYLLDKIPLKNFHEKSRDPCDPSCHKSSKFHSRVVPKKEGSPKI